MREPRSYAAIFQPRDGKSFSRQRSHVVRAEPAAWRPGRPRGGRGESGLPTPAGTGAELHRGERAEAASKGLQR